MGVKGVDNAAMRDLAKSFIGFAREHDLELLKAKLEVDGARYELIYEHPRIKGVLEEETLDRGEELVTIKTGPQSRPKIVLAGPAEWLL